MTTPQKKASAVIFSIVMIVSIVGSSVALGGLAAASDSSNITEGNTSSGQLFGTEDSTEQNITNESSQNNLLALNNGNELSLDTSKLNIQEIRVPSETDSNKEIEIQSGAEIPNAPVADWSANLEFQAYVDDTLVGTQNISVKDGEKANVSIQHKFQNSGNKEVYLKISGKLERQGKLDSQTQTIERTTQTVTVDVIPPTTTKEGAVFVPPESIQQDIDELRSEIPQTAGSHAFVLTSSDSLYIIFAEEEPREGYASVEGFYPNVSSIEQDELEFGVIVAKNISFDDPTQVSVKEVYEDTDQYDRQYVEITAYHRSTSVDYENTSYSLTTGILTDNQTTKEELFESVGVKSRTVIKNSKNDNITTVLEDVSQPHVVTPSYETEYWDSTEVTMRGIIIEPNTTIGKFIESQREEDLLPANSTTPILYKTGKEYNAQQVSNISKISTNPEVYDGETVQLEANMYMNTISTKRVIEYATGTTLPPVDTILHGGIAWEKLPENRDDVIGVIGASSINQTQLVQDRKGQYNLTGEIISTDRIESSLPQGYILIAYDIEKMGDVDTVSTNDLIEQQTSNISNILEQRANPETDPSDLEDTESDINASELSGDGSKSNPYQIANASELQAMEDDLSASYVLGSDIDASGTSEWNGGAGFDPVGGNPYQDYNPDHFTGSFDGRDHTITGLTIDRPSADYVGIVGFSDGSVTNVTVENVNVTGNQKVGGLVGTGGNVVNAAVSGTVTGMSDVGGLVGDNTGIARNVTASVAVSGSSYYTGGLVGDNRAVIQNATASGNVDGDVDVGGLVGLSDGGATIRNAMASGNVTGTEDVGGLVGANVGVVDTTAASGSVNGTDRVGGLAGINYPSGLDTKITDSFATGTVTGTSDVGGLVGNNPRRSLGPGFRDGTVRDSYWDRESTGQSGSAANATGLTTSLMTGGVARISMPGLDFDSAWQTTAGDYPVLSAQSGTRDGSGGTSEGAAVRVTDSLEESGTSLSRLTVDQAAYVAVENGTIVGAPHYVVVYERLQDGSLSTAVGNSTQLSPGVHENVTVNLSVQASPSDSLDTVTTNTTLVAKLHEPEGDTFGSPIQLSGSEVTDVANISIRPNRPPTAALEAFYTGERIANGSRIEGSSDFVFRADNSTDPNGDSLTYEFDQVSGPAADIGAENISDPAAARVAVPPVDTPQTVTFNVTVSDGEFSHTDTIQFTITEQVNVDPDELDGTGTRDDPYRVSNASELQAIEDDIDGHYALVSDIDASVTSEWNGDLGFDPIYGKETLQTPRPAFSGSLDGRNHTVSGLVSNTSAENQSERPAGLFEANNGRIADMRLEAANVTGTRSVGVLAGLNLGTVENVSVSGNVSGHNDVGGLVGLNRDRVVNSSAAGAISVLDREDGPFAPLDREDDSPALGEDNPPQTAGGLVGENEGTVANSTAQGNVSFVGTYSFDRYIVGGLVGDNAGTVENSHAIGTISGFSQSVGGLVGKNRDSGSIRKSYATGNISAVGSVGGLVGENLGVVNESYATGNVSGLGVLGSLVGDNQDVVRNTYATGDITFTRDTNEPGFAGGGLVGRNNGTIETSYATGYISNSEYVVGGLVGENTATVQKSYWDLNTSNQSASAGGIGLTTDQLKTNTSLTGFDFQNSWTVVDKDTATSYPYLRTNTQQPAPGLVDIDDGGDPADGGTDGSDSTDGDDGTEGDDGTDGGDGNSSFAVSGLDPQDITFTVGNTLTVTATIDNVGDASGTQTVEYRIGGTTYASKEVTLSPGENTTVEFTDIGMTNLVADDYEHGVFTENVSQTGTLTVEAETGGDTDDSTPGFGSVASLLALVLFVLLTRRERD